MDGNKFKMKNASAENQQCVHVFEPYYLYSVIKSDELLNEVNVSV